MEWSDFIVCRIGTFHLRQNIDFNRPFHQVEPGRNLRSGLSFLFCLFTRVFRGISVLSALPILISSELVSDRRWGRMIGLL